MGKSVEKKLTEQLMKKRLRYGVGEHLSIGLLPYLDTIDTIERTKQRIMERLHIIGNHEISIRAEAEILEKVFKIIREEI